MLITIFIGILLLYFMQSGTVFIPLWICILYAFVLSTNSIVLLIRIKTIITIHLAKSTKN
jgi:hypothetical protein